MQPEQIDEDVLPAEVPANESEVTEEMEDEADDAAAANTDR